MPVYTCNACNSEFQTDEQQKLHYKSEWHRYNLKRKVAGVPGVTEALFQARLAALAEEQKKKLDETRMQYTCTLCSKEYRSAKAHAQHLNSRSHIMRMNQVGDVQSAGVTVLKPLRNSTSSKSTAFDRHFTHNEMENDEDEDSDEEWEEVDPDDLIIHEAAEAMTNLNVKAAVDSDLIPSESVGDGWNLSHCFICDMNPDSTIKGCVQHMHKEHGFFIPDVEYLKDPTGLLAFLATRVVRDFVCLYCHDRRQPFASLEAVRKHMISKSHCKVKYGEGGDDEDAELEDFYDYSSSYMDENGKQLVAVDENSNVELGCGGELMITREAGTGISTKIIGARQFARYYRQKPRSTSVEEEDEGASHPKSIVRRRYGKMSVLSVQSRGGFVGMKILKVIRRTGMEPMRARLGIKNNVIRNLPKNVPY
ncbi:cytoplasmic 60S subunit biogenesis factor REI1 homolog 1 isoform X2 [Nymphaea colorata]|uniref:cytoplasmic 60S subunit biogenesis factor REI1 homolog 1 isoform X2 n=1 Tax=Nymphaea colorata TaxID=210225 RepID=UPI00129D850D|nr:cytoplasmic 60S subunit biogenesis factor REI1 homolog 1 isoform X2 [Nymphaea colorata]